MGDRIIRVSWSGTAPDDRGEAHAGRVSFPVTIEPHSYQVFRIER